MTDSGQTSEATERHVAGGGRALGAAGAGRSGHDGISERMEEILLPRWPHSSSGRGPPAVGPWGRGATTVLSQRPVIMSG